MIDKKYHVQKYFIDISGHQYCYHYYQSRQITNQRAIMLLHGAGVAGVDTWSNIIKRLTQWQYVLVPDLRGMGETHSHSKQELGFSVDELVDDLAELVSHLKWSAFDLAGYSLGGLVSMLFKQRFPNKVLQQFVLEPGLLDRMKWEDSIALRDVYAKTVTQLRGGSASAGVIDFLNTISPNRKVQPSAEKMAVERLLKRQLGFANALECVNLAAQHIDREQLGAAQGSVLSLIGGLSVDSMHQYHQHLAYVAPRWRYVSIAGTDHSLPYQKPRQIAALFNSAELKIS